MSAKRSSTGLFGQIVLTLRMILEHKNVLQIIEDVQKNIGLNFSRDLGFLLSFLVWLGEAVAAPPMRHRLWGGGGGLRHHLHRRGRRWWWSKAICATDAPLILRRWSKAIMTAAWWCRADSLFGVYVRSGRHIRPHKVRRS